MQGAYGRNLGPIFTPGCLRRTFRSLVQQGHSSTFYSRRSVTCSRQNSPRHAKYHPRYRWSSSLLASRMNVCASVVPSIISQNPIHNSQNNQHEATSCRPTPYLQ
ncbi:hypothetical protein H4Q26_004991 [Puccinia striiformis f. sp. tritici PST-130]|nr:hypothetical protein H4Q26_004991 [Puccinia striiformis f. sp. tritici PST-130]